MLKICSSLLLLLSFTAPNTVAHPLDRIQGLLLTYHDHLLEQEQTLQQMTAKTQIDKAILEVNKANISQAFGYVEDHLLLLKRINTGHLTLNNYLVHLLRTRLSYLKEGTDRIIASETSIGPIYTDPHMIEKLEAKTPASCIDKVLQKHEMFTWEHRQLLIKTTFDVINKEDLSQEVIELLKVSPSLWNLLANKTYDLGYPDYAGRYGPLFFVTELLPEDPPLLWINTAKAWYKLTWGKIESLPDLAKRVKETEWLEAYKKHLPHLDGELFRIRFGNEKVTEPSLMLGAKPRRRVSFELSGSSKWDDVFPDINELLPPKKEECPFVEEMSFSQAMAAEAAQKQKFLVPALSADLSPREAEEDEEPLETVEYNLPFLVEPKPIQKEESYVEDFKENPLSDSSSKTYTYTFPRALRLLRHDLASAPFKPCANPDKQVQEFVDLIFNTEQKCKVTFQDFERHWKRLGGKVIGNRGGSHRQLFTPHNTPLFGTYDHGGFGKDTIRYLQAAFVLEGYKPSGYDALVIS